MPRANRNAEKGELTRSAILKAAVELFGENGFRATTMNQIASRAGVVQSALHHHFGGKDQLLDAALKLHYPPAASRPDIEAVAEGKSNFVDEVLRAANRNAQDRDLVRFFSVMTGESLTGDHPAHEFFVARYELVRQGFADAIAKAKGIESEESRRLILLLVSILFAASDGLQMQWLRNPSFDFTGAIELAAAVTRERLDTIN
ncbi:MAG: TetR/AcrR family transcriptional regulator [Alphaproteobacteria bacterium]|nr:MAG: TetR/AcrR family transcriptional regulator [Alphaproteobacteria bacterium]